MELTIYSDDFDKGENVVNDGMSGYAFLEENGTGKCFSKANEALAYVARLGLAVDTLTYCYKLPSTGEQMFRKFKLAPLAEGKHEAGAVEEAARKLS